MKTHHLQQHFHDLLAPLFPREAEFVAVPADSDSLLYRVLWKTPTKDRPNKLSRPIELHLTSETLDDYEVLTTRSFSGTLTSESPNTCASTWRPSIQRTTCPRMFPCRQSAGQFIPTRWGAR